MTDMQSFLMHYGIKGQKHGVRRFQNEDGSLTAEGKERYGFVGKSEIPKHAKVDGQSSNPSISKPFQRQGAIASRINRWKRGRQLNKEKFDIYNKTLEDMKSKDKEYQKNKAEVERLSKEYHLNENGSGGDRERYSSRDLRRASDRHWEHSENMRAAEHRMSEKAEKHAKQMISQKYGKTAMSDIKHYENTNSVAFLGSMAALSIGLYYLHKKR